MIHEHACLKKVADRHFKGKLGWIKGDLCKTPICGAFLRCVLLARLPIYLICLRSLRCYALNCIHN